MIVYSKNDPELKMNRYREYKFFDGVVLFKIKQRCKFKILGLNFLYLIYAKYEDAQRYKFRASSMRMEEFLTERKAMLYLRRKFKKFKCLKCGNNEFIMDKTSKYPSKCANCNELVTEQELIKYFRYKKEINND